MTGEFTVLHEFIDNFTHNLFKPLLLFFYAGFLMPIFHVKLEFPKAVYQGLTIYLLLAIGWKGGGRTRWPGTSSLRSSGSVYADWFLHQFADWHCGL